jgi:hypothetical protein
MKKALLLGIFGLFVLGAHAVPFLLQNKSSHKISLVIPGVMNPNLSPISNSSVDLAVGQQIFFYHGNKKNGKGKQYLLLEVSEELRDQKLDVSKLIQLRKKELGLK